MKITYQGWVSAYQRCLLLPPPLSAWHLWWSHCVSGVMGASPGVSWRAVSGVSSNNVGSVTRLACSRFNASNGHTLSRVQPRNADTSEIPTNISTGLCSLMLVFVTCDANQGRCLPIMFWCVNKRPELVHFHQSQSHTSFSKIFVCKILEFQECNVKNGPFAASYFYTSKRRRLEFTSPGIFCFVG